MNIRLSEQNSIMLAVWEKRSQEGSNLHDVWTKDNQIPQLRNVTFCHAPIKHLLILVTKGSINLKTKLLGSLQGSQPAI